MSWLRSNREIFSKVQIEQISREKIQGQMSYSDLTLSNPKTTVRILVELLNKPSTAKELAIMAIDAPD